MNTNMRLLALILILIFPTWAVAQKFDKNITVADLGNVAVSITDLASNGCWTNLREAKSYAEGQIELIGGSVVGDRATANNEFLIQVLAERWGGEGSSCYGSITAGFSKLGYVGDYFSVILHSHVHQIAIRQDNFNTLLLDHIKKAISEWR